jgi:hypothetical protein
MSKLPAKIRRRLKREATQWDLAVAGESPHEVQEILEQTELFLASRPPRQPVSLRLDPYDLALAKRLARRKGIPYTQLIAMWLHERVEHEKGKADA